MNISTTIPFPIRLRLHLIALFTVIFLVIYAKIVCPFIDTLTTTQLATSLGIGYWAWTIMKFANILKYQ